MYFLRDRAVLSILDWTDIFIAQFKCKWWRTISIVCNVVLSGWYEALALWISHNKILSGYNCTVTLFFFSTSGQQQNSSRKHKEGFSHKKHYNFSFSRFRPKWNWALRTSRIFLNILGWELKKANKTICVWAELIIAWMLTYSPPLTTTNCKPL